MSVSATKLSFINTQTVRWLLLPMVVILSACARQRVVPAPIVERGIEMGARSSSFHGRSSAAASLKTQVYIVKKGDTLYGISFEAGIDVDELVALNHIDNPSEIQIGQTLRIPMSEFDDDDVAVNKATSPTSTSRGGSRSKAGSKAKPVRANSTRRTYAQKRETVREAENVVWGMPTSGKLIAGFSKSENRKGIDIIGRRGQPVVASAGGKVVYSGSALRGYGKLVIIKHNKIFLSAYAHNDKVLVKEGQSVNKGQTIAKMGSTGSNQVMLHFEIRRLGKPVNPAQYLPLNKS